MHTTFDDDDEDRPDEIDQAQDTDTKFGEQDETAQDAEYAEDAREGGS